ncbi:MAG: hypothetical protein CM15mV7_2340 [uncultured marine virus]|nr:MAG: hypothetical protein CM15mV7_2340 [uncultured marine virus]
MQLPETEVIARVNTTTATSVGDGGGEGGSSPRDQSSFINSGQYYDVVLNEENSFTSPQMIASKINEQNKLDGNKSLTMAITLNTEKESLSPCLDLDRMSLITTTNRVNMWLSGLHHTDNKVILIGLRTYQRYLQVTKTTRFILLVLQDWVVKRGHQG